MPLSDAGRPQPHFIVTAEQCRAYKQSVNPEDMLWGTYGPNADQELKFFKLTELDTDHLENILITQCHVAMNYRAAIIAVLKSRYIDMGKHDPH